MFDASGDSNETLAQRRAMLMDLIKEGLMYDEEGKFSHSAKKKCLDLLGFGLWEDSLDLNVLQINKAKEENILVEKNSIEILPIDDHKIHIDEHIAFLLGKEIKNKKNQKSIQEKLLKHIEEHRKLLNQEINKGE